MPEMPEMPDFPQIVHVMTPEQVERCVKAWEQLAKAAELFARRGADPGDR